MSRYGFPESFAVELRFDSGEAVDSSDDVTRGGGSVFLGGHRVWPPAGDESARFEWTWIELLEHLATFWAHLMWEEGLPLGLRPSDAKALWDQLDEQLEAAPTAQADADRAMAELGDFLQAHDLALAIQGAVLPSIVLIREGRYFWVCAPGRTSQLSEQLVVRTLEGVGDGIAGRLEAAPDERATKAVESWRNRLDRSAMDRVRISTGRSAEEVFALSGEESLKDSWDLDRTSLQDTNELLAVARSATSVTIDALRSVLAQVRDQPFVERQALDELALRAQFELASVSTARPHEQGYHLARWFRVLYATGGSAAEGPIDPQRILSEWGIDVVDLSGDLPPELDAVSCWGDLRGPTVFVNPGGVHSGSVAGRRTTLAHEICHLLIDRRGALPFAEVLTSDSRGRVESRANAFAAELLIPQSVAGPALSGSDFEEAFTRLKDRFGASSEVIAWQARNSGSGLAPEAQDFLRAFVSHPDRY